MTTLTGDKPVTRETARGYRGRPIIVRLHAGYMEIWEKQRRDRLTVDYADLLQFAQRIHYLATKRAKR